MSQTKAAVWHGLRADDQNEIKTLPPYHIANIPSFSSTNNF
jgi:hypothetical protein